MSLEYTNENTNEKTLPSGKPVIFRGAATALVTPFSGGEVDIECMRRLVRRQIDSGISALVSTGTTGESPTLTESEIAAITAAVVDETAGRVPVIACVGGNNTAKCIRLAGSAAASGVDAVMAVTPYYNKTTPDGVIRHFTAIADASPVPLIVYNVPPRTSVRVTAEMYGALAAHENIVGVKEASGDVSLAADILSEYGDSLSVYSGCDELTLPIMALGGAGVVSVVSNILPAETEALCRACIGGSLSEARRRQLALHKLIRALFSRPNPIPVKRACELVGLCASEVRLPLVQPENDEELRAVLREYGVI